MVHGGQVSRRMPGPLQGLSRSPEDHRMRMRMPHGQAQAGTPESAHAAAGEEIPATACVVAALLLLPCQIDDWRLLHFTMDCGCRCHARPRELYAVGEEELL